MIILSDKIPCFTIDRNLNLTTTDPNDQTTQGISNYDCGSTIEEAIELLRPLKYEVAVLFNSQLQRFYCSTIYEPNHTILHIPDAWHAHIHLFVHHHPHDNTSFSINDLIAIQAYGCPNALLICQNLLFLLEKLPRDWNAEAPKELKTSEALASFLNKEVASAWLPHDPFKAYDEAIENMVMKLNCNGISAKYTVLDASGKTLMTTPGTYSIDQMLQYNDYMHYLRFIKPLESIIQS